MKLWKFCRLVVVITGQVVLALLIWATFPLWIIPILIVLRDPDDGIGPHGLTLDGQHRERYLGDPVNS